MITSYGLIIELPRNEKLQKYRIILSQHINYLHEWLIHLKFGMFFGAMFFFLWDSLMCASLEQHSISFNGLAHLNWHFMELEQHVYRAGGRCWMQALFHAIRNFLANEIYHFSRLSHLVGCFFTWASCSI